MNCGKSRGIIVMLGTSDDPKVLELLAKCQATLVQGVTTMLVTPEEDFCTVEIVTKAFDIGPLTADELEPYVFADHRVKKSKGEKKRARSALFRKGRK